MKRGDGTPERAMGSFGLRRWPRGAGADRGLREFMQALGGEEEIYGLQGSPLGNHAVHKAARQEGGCHAGPAGERSGRELLEKAEGHL